jgi:AbrB family looped-hinge helix DNA binding protein
MVRIQAFKGGNKLATGKRGKEYWKHFVIIPKVLINALGWKKGDELEFKLEGGKVLLRRKEE